MNKTKILHGVFGLIGLSLGFLWGYSTMKSQRIERNKAFEFECLETADAARSNGLALSTCLSALNKCVHPQHQEVGK